MKSWMPKNWLIAETWYTKICSRCRSQGWVIHSQFPFTEFWWFFWSFTKFIVENKFAKQFFGCLRFFAYSKILVSKHLLLKLDTWNYQEPIFVQASAHTRGQKNQKMWTCVAERSIFFIDFQTKPFFDPKMRSLIRFDLQICLRILGELCSVDRRTKKKLEAGQS